MKSLFIIKIQSQSDVITNSSSELFIFNDKNSKEEVIYLLNNVYPDWRKEYDEPVPFSEVTEDSLWYLIPNSRYDILDDFRKIVYKHTKESNVKYQDFLCTPECNELLKEFNENLRIEKYKLPEVKFARECGLEPEIFWDNFNGLKIEIDGQEWKFISCPFFRDFRKR